MGADNDSINGLLFGKTELAETKRKLEIAVKGLRDVKMRIEMTEGLARLEFDEGYQYHIITKCLKDLGVE